MDTVGGVVWQLDLSEGDGETLLVVRMRVICLPNAQVGRMFQEWESNRRECSVRSNSGSTRRFRIRAGLWSIGVMYQ